MMNSLAGTCYLCNALEAQLAESAWEMGQLVESVLAGVEGS